MSNDASSARFPTLDRRLVLAGLGTLLTGGLAACGPRPNAPEPTPELHFTDEGRLAFATRGPVVEDHRANSGDSSLESALPLKPYEAFKTWVGERIATTGSGNATLKIMVLNAYVAEDLPAKEEGVKALFMDQVEATYTAFYEIELSIVDGTGAERARTRAKVSHKRAVAERDSVDTRNRVWFELVADALRDADRQLTTGVRTYFSAWLVQ